MKVVLWDKLTPINGVSAEEFLQRNSAISSDDIILVKRGNTVTRVESVRIMADLASIDVEGKTPTEIFEEFERKQAENSENGPIEVALKELKQRQESTDGMVLQLLMEGMM